MLNALALGSPGAVDALPWAPGTQSVLIVPGTSYISPCPFRAPPLLPNGQKLGGGVQAMSWSRQLSPPLSL